METALIKRIMSLAARMDFKKGATIFMEGAPLKGLYILEKGLVKIYKLSSEGREQVLHIVREGETFAGAPIFLRKATCPAFAQAIESSTVILIPKDSLLGLIKKNPDIAIKILESFSGYLNDLVSLVDDLSLKDVSHRLARFLLELAKSKGVSAKKGVLIETGFTKQDIAAQVGTVREVISRTLSQFQAKGLIKVEGKAITILNRAGLESLS